MTRANHSREAAIAREFIEREEHLRRKGEEREPQVALATEHGGVVPHPEPCFGEGETVDAVAASPGGVPGVGQAVQRVERGDSGPVDGPLPGV